MILNHLIWHVVHLLCYFRGRNVYMQFSSHQELTTDQNSHGRNSDQVCTHIYTTLDFSFLNFRTYF